MTADARAALFDIDGTLVDSNYLHVRAWSLAFADVGHRVDDWLIHRSIGLDSDKLLAECLGDQADELGDRASDGHTEHYLALTGELRPFAGARELLRHVAEAGSAVVLATSAPDDELTILREVLNADRWITAATSADDAETAKPAPDIVQVALEKAAVPADQAVFIGDTVWDGKAAAATGVPFVAVRSGGIGEDELRAAGARRVYRDVAEIRDRLGAGGAWY